MRARRLACHAVGLGLVLSGAAWGQNFGQPGGAGSGQQSVTLNNAPVYDASAQAAALLVGQYRVPGAGLVDPSGTYRVPAPATAGSSGTTSTSTSASTTTGGSTTTTTTSSP